jgi:hypothetical protein
MKSTYLMLKLRIAAALGDARQDGSQFADMVVV